MAIDEESKGDDLEKASGAGLRRAIGGKHLCG